MEITSCCQIVEMDKSISIEPCRHFDVNKPCQGEHGTCPLGYQASLKDVGLRIQNVKLI